MAAPKLPVIDPALVPAVVGSTLVPEPYRVLLEGRSRQKLGEAAGLSRFGVNLTTLAPGGQSSLRHWHSHEDELVFVLSGELTLVTDDGEQVIGAGMAAGFPAGRANAHHLVNRGAVPARFLEIGDRNPNDRTTYPDDDLMWVSSSTGDLAAHKDGSLYE